MYAIRSYYEMLQEKLMDLFILLNRAMFIVAHLQALQNIQEVEMLAARITSYNVCYTKLLRNGVEIPGATMQKYYTGDKTLCGTYSCRVSYTRNGGEQVRYTADYTFSHNCDAATVAIYPTILKKRNNFV